MANWLRSKTLIRENCVRDCDWPRTCIRKSNVIQFSLARVVQAEMGEKNESGADVSLSRDTFWTSGVPYQYSP